LIKGEDIKKALAKERGKPILLFYHEKGRGNLKGGGGYFKFS